MNQPALLTPVAEPGSNEVARIALRARFDALQASLEHKISEYAAQTGRPQAVAQQRLLLYMELPLKLQEQLLLPALQDAEPGWAAELQTLSLELKLLRDAGELLRCSAALCHELSLALLQGMARLHCARLQAVLRRPGAAAVDWPAVQQEADEMFERWAEEIRDSGDIEDEEADPVGAPTR